MVVGDGSLVRAAIERVLAALHVVAAPTGARGSILLMTGGLIVIGFLFLALVFRSAIVGDLAPVSNARAPSPRALLPPERPLAPRRRAGSTFDRGRALGREAKPPLDAALESLRGLDVDLRIVGTRESRTRVRLYACPTCAWGGDDEGCAFERGLVVGAFEALTGDLATARETACSTEGAPFCEFEVRHAPWEAR